MPSLRVASYNLRGLKDSAEAAAAVVRAVAPDVLLLQELPRYPGSEYAVAAFARRCDLLWSGRTRLLSGTGLMTALRVTATDSVDRRLRVGLRENPRGYTQTRVRLPEGPQVDVVSVHLSLRAEQRVEHASTVLAELAAGREDPEQVPLVVGGDLNEGRDGAAWGVLAAGLEEVSADRPTFPAHQPHRHIDAVFARGHRAARPGDPAVLEGMPLREASDHLPVWVDMEV